jgi:hypothetical protein
MIRPLRLRHRLAGAALCAALALVLTACFGSSSGGAKDNPDADVTITFWHGWSAPNEVAAIQSTIDAFEKVHPNIHVKAVGNITDDKINQALRAGGSHAPDVVSSFTTQQFDNRKEGSNRHDIRRSVRSQFAYISAVIRRAFRAVSDRARRGCTTSPAPPPAPPGETT